jgi:hypothetical protein
VDEEWGNPAYDEDSAPSAFNFHLMNPGRIFTMAGEQYRYLENMGNGNHLIIRNDSIRHSSWEVQPGVLTSWYGQLDPAVQAMVQPVAHSFTTGEVADGNDLVTFTGYRWIPNNLEGAVAADITQVVPGGRVRAFALSLADVARLSGPGLAFPNHAQRASVAIRWWLRTPAPGRLAWFVNNQGNLHGGSLRTVSNANGGVRPALIINPSN